MFFVLDISKHSAGRSSSPVTNNAGDPHPLLNEKRIKKTNLETIKSRLQSILKDKSSGITPEAQKKIDELVKRIEDLLSNSDGACDIPDEVIKEIARCLVPDIITFFETEEAKREFEAWKLEQKKKK